MHCTECHDLYRAFERRAARYNEARASAFALISPMIAVRTHVDMQRAQNDLLEHQDDCPWAIAAANVSQARH